MLDDDLCSHDRLASKSPVFRSSADSTQRPRVHIYYRIRTEYVASMIPLISLNLTPFGCQVTSCNNHPINILHPVELALSGWLHKQGSIRRTSVTVDPNYFEALRISLEEMSPRVPGSDPLLRLILVYYSKNLSQFQVR